MPYNTSTLGALSEFLSSLPPATIPAWLALLISVISLFTSLIPQIRKSHIARMAAKNCVTVIEVKPDYVAVNMGSFPIFDIRMHDTLGRHTGHSLIYLKQGERHVLEFRNSKNTIAQSSSGPYCISYYDNQGSLWRHVLGTKKTNKIGWLSKRYSKIRKKNLWSLKV